MGQGLRRRNVPASAVGRRLAHDEHVAVLLGELALLCSAKEVGGRPGTGVQDKHDRRLGLQPGRDVDEHFNTRRVAAKVLDLRERCPLDQVGRLDDGHGLHAGEGKEAGEQD
jgi:hypothetical protein